MSRSPKQKITASEEAELSKKRLGIRNEPELFFVGESAIARLIRAIPSASALIPRIHAITRDTASGMRTRRPLALPDACLRKMRTSRSPLLCAYGGGVRSTTESPNNKKHLKSRCLGSAIKNEGESASPYKVSLGETASRGFELPCRIALLASGAILLHEVAIE